MVERAAERTEHQGPTITQTAAVTTSTAATAALTTTQQRARKGELQVAGSTLHFLPRRLPLWSLCVGVFLPGQPSLDACLVDVDGELQGEGGDGSTELQWDVGGAQQRKVVVVDGVGVLGGGGDVLRGGGGGGGGGGRGIGRVLGGTCGGGLGEGEEESLVRRSRREACQELPRHSRTGLQVLTVQFQLLDDLGCFGRVELLH